MQPQAQARAAKVRHAMRAAGLHGLLLYSDARHALGGPGTDGVRWLSGFKPMAEACVVLPVDDEPRLVITPPWDLPRARRRGWLAQTSATCDLPGGLAEVVAALGLERGQVGLVGAARCQAAMRQSLNALFSTPLVEFDATFEGLTRVRDELELANVRAAAELAERGYAHLLEEARPGVPEYQMVGELAAYLRAEGADDSFLLVAASRQHPAIRVAGDRLLDVGDVILGEISPSVNGDFAQVCRTAVLGPTSSHHQECHAVLVDSMQRGLRAGTPGVTVGEMVEAMNEPLIQAGFGRYCQQPYMRVRGHGLGLGSTAPGDLTVDNHTPLEAGMVFVLHPNQFLPHAGYLMVGEPVQVTDAGLQPFTSRNPALDSIPV